MYDKTHTFVRLRVVAVAATAGLCLQLHVPRPCKAAPPVFEQMAVELTPAVRWIESSVRPAISESGTVVFTGYPTTYIETAARAIYMRTSPTAPMVRYDMPNGRTEPAVLQTQAGSVVYLARPKGANNYFGVYRIGINGSTGAGVIHESAAEPVKRKFLSVSPNGTVAFSTLYESTGGIRKGPLAGPFPVFRQGTGFIFNTMGFDVNDIGVVATQLEYGGTSGGLKRGIFVFDAPNEPLTSTTTAIEGTSIGHQPQPSINIHGEVAFALNDNVTVQIGGKSVTYRRGVYKVTPVGFGVNANRNITPIVESSAYTEYGHVELNDEGLVVFEATKQGGRFGVFYGPDPVAHKIITDGDLINGVPSVAPQFGGLNNSGQMALKTMDLYNKDNRIWRVTVTP